MKEIETLIKKNRFFSLSHGAYDDYRTVCFMRAKKDVNLDYLQTKWINETKQIGSDREYNINGFSEWLSSNKFVTIIPCEDFNMTKD